jgi:tetratricopeptide (TPR) repeat protein
MAVAVWKSIALAGAVSIALVGGSAAADPLDDCRRARAAEIKFAACAAVIADATAPTETRATAYRYRAEGRSEAGAFADAIADFTAGLALAPDSVALLAGRARARLMAGDRDGAVADYSEALRRAPRNTAVLLERGHAHLARGDLDAAIADFDDGAKADPKNASIFNSRGLAHRRRGDLDKAEADFTRAIALNPIYALAYANRGYLREARGRKKDAVADLETALLLDPSMTSVADGLKRLGGGRPTLAKESERRIAEGRRLVENNCSRCHAVGPDGSSAHDKAPAFRDLQKRHPLLELREPLTRGIAAPHDEMPRFRASDAEIDAIVAYVNFLNGKR